MGLVPSPPGKITHGEILLKGKDLTNYPRKKCEKFEEMKSR